MKTDSRLFFFVSDLHGSLERYNKLFALIEEERPEAVLLGGDLLPMFYITDWNKGSDRQDFILDYLEPGFARLRTILGDNFPQVFLILGNDDLRADEVGLLEGERRGIWRYAHGRHLQLGDLSIYGYSYVPPTPFRLKDWERYDVSRYVDPGCVSPEEGWHSVDVSTAQLRYTSILKDLRELTGDDDLSRSIFLFHSPPYKTLLDRAALDGKSVDHVPLDLNVGSIAIQRFIAARQPLLTLHGHVHESTRITGSWRDLIGKSHAFQAAHDGPELSIIRFDPDKLRHATRTLL
ncbi:MAG: hypothetical protein GY835_08685 [bacterium]|nr:hypothetical protein [bacterium]